MSTDKQIEIHQATDGQTEIEVHLEADTVWLSQVQMVELFGRDVSVISRHICNALKEKEISRKAICKKCKLQIPTAQLPSTT